MYLVTMDIELSDVTALYLMYTFSMHVNLQCDFWHFSQICCWYRLCSYFRTILLSIISLLNEPNTCSPANVDASISFRKWRDSKGKDKEYELIVRYAVLLLHCDLFCVYFLGFQRAMHSLERIVALLPWCSSVCLSGTGVHCDHMVHVSADLYGWIV